MRALLASGLRKMSGWLRHRRWRTGTYSLREFVLPSNLAANRTVAISMVGPGQNAIVHNTAHEIS